MKELTVTVLDQESAVCKCEYSGEEVPCLLVGVSFPQWFGGAFHDNTFEMYLSKTLVLADDLEGLPTLLAEQYQESRICD